MMRTFTYSMLSMLVLILIDMLVAPKPLYAQTAPVVNSMENYNAPYKINRMNCAVNVGPGNAGANQQWNFSNLVPNTATQEWVATTAITPESAQFPTANEVRITVDGPDTTFMFYNKTTTGTTNIGVAGNGYRIFYTPGIPSAKRPLYYNDNFQQSYGESATAGGPQFGEGTVTHTVDGWGTLQLPNGTFQNVLRVKTIFHQTDTGTGPSPTIFTLDATRYMWFSDAYKTPLLLWDSTIVDYGTGNLQTKIVSYLVSEGDPAGVANVTANELDVTAYFSDERLFVTGGLSAGRMYDLSLFTITGQKIFNTQFAGNAQNAFEPGVTLSSGIYMVMVSERGGGAVGVRKVVKQ